MKSLLLLAAAVLLTSCGGDAPRRAVQAEGPLIRVRAVTVANVDWPSTYEATGTVRASSSATISSKVMGYVQQAGVHVGDHVRAGQVLVILEARDLESNVQRAEAGRTEVQSAIPEADSGLAAAKANLDLAQATYKRMEELAAKKSISNQEFDEASARMKAAQANYEMARSRRRQLDSRFAQVEQEVRFASITREYTRIVAPFAGVVVTKNVEQGNLATPGAPLLTIDQEGAYRLEASIDESKLPDVRRGQSVDVLLDGSNVPVAARVSEIVPAVDAASRSYIVKIDLPANPRLRSGIFGRAVFKVGTRKVLAIPATGLMERGQLQSVFVVENGVARTRLVTTGTRTADSVELLSGLNAGEMVVYPIPPGLQDGSRVEVQ